MVVVPYGALTVEAKVLKRDAGFVHKGQDVAVKLEAFPFTRYGTAPGRIESISGDAVDDKKLGPVYFARVALLRSTIDAVTGLCRSAPAWPQRRISARDGGRL